MIKLLLASVHSRTSTRMSQVKEVASCQAVRKSRPVVGTDLGGDAYRTSVVIGVDSPSYAQPRTATVKPPRVDCSEIEAAS